MRIHVSFLGHLTNCIEVAVRDAPDGETPKMAIMNTKGTLSIEGKPALYQTLLFERSASPDGGWIVTIPDRDFATSMEATLANYASTKGKQS